MKTIRWWSDTGYYGEEKEGTFEVEDTATEEDIKEKVLQEIFDFLDWGYDVE